jgi:anion-transporting  ArsA/GET3 family ATPase
MPMDELLQTQRLLVVLGQGGVGKTTVSAALGIRAAYLGVRAAVITIDPANRLADAFALKYPMHNQTQIKLDECDGSLHAMMLDRQQTCDTLVDRFSADDASRNKILNNPYYRHFSTSLAGGQEYMAIETVCQQLASDKFDLIILDTPPSVHAFDFLDAPKRLINGLKRLPSIDRKKPDSFVRRVREKGGAIVLDGLRRFTGGRFLTDLTEFLGLFRHVLSALSKSSEQLEATLKHPSTGFIYVDIKDHAVKSRIKDCRSALNKRNLNLQGILFNRTRPTVSQLNFDAMRTHLERSLVKRGEASQLESLHQTVCKAMQQLAGSDREFVSTFKLEDPSIKVWSLPLKRDWISNVAALSELSNDITDES